IGGYVDLANTTIEDNGGFIGVFVSEGVLQMDGGNAISQPDNSGPGDQTMFLSNATLNQFMDSGPDSVTGPGGTDDVAIAAFRHSNFQLWNMAVSRGAAGTAIELNHKSIGEFQGSTTVTGGVSCFGSHVEFIDNTGGGVDSTSGC
ncbi:MAG: hypothetical protein ACE5KF_05910, partial [Kiloniellaceae bacterium]